ncbi:hypothetical protein Xmau_03576 [Xenorhabdus mauleonii]|uniref:Uncharacterized protein n=1 Tax=Xenorhabdus mauleonii TaxID=351675 RepID=A0A1I3X1X4_9GAMM|nr:hypothetical protein [Xenorhabdus mauleonii]PHM38189.1 hypothetical protein Xmau_03576 [Xenorhabdus mauleonii]SFK13580.1 hypothetical protein SAMN05421680_13125 [Xenorhabdus mauleonii]
MSYEHQLAYNAIRTHITQYTRSDNGVISLEILKISPTMLIRQFPNTFPTKTQVTRLFSDLGFIKSMYFNEYCLDIHSCGINQRIYEQEILPYIVNSQDNFSSVILKHHDDIVAAGVREKLHYPYGSRPTPTNPIHQLPQASTLSGNNQPMHGLSRAQNNPPLSRIPQGSYPALHAALFGNNSSPPSSPQQDVHTEEGPYAYQRGAPLRHLSTSPRPSTSRLQPQARVRTPSPLSSALNNPWGVDMEDIDSFLQEQRGSPNLRR